MIINREFSNIVAAIKGLGLLPVVQGELYSVTAFRPDLHWRAGTAAFWIRSHNRGRTWAVYAKLPSNNRLDAFVAAKTLGIDALGPRNDLITEENAS